MKLPDSYIIFDIETTGFSGTKNKCIEIGALKIVDGQVISTFECLLDWDIPEADYIPDINGITADEVLEKGIRPDVAINEFKEFIGIKFPLMGHNVIKFDIPFLEGNFSGMSLFSMLPVLDTAVMFKAMKCGMEMQDQESFSDFAKRVLGSKQYYGVKYSMDTAIQELGLDKSKITQHRALGDCYLTHQLYQKLCIKLKKNEGSSIV